MVIVVQDDDSFGTSEDEGKRSLREGMGFDACSATMRLAIRAKPSTSPALSRLPASQLSGESAFGAASNARTARTTLTKVQAGLQASFRMSKQTSPVLS
tara:strand:+ start:1604 stop:1900 length:297 start_codon:yes stop_codon:yes gene_type:complete